MNNKAWAIYCILVALLSFSCNRQEKKADAPAADTSIVVTRTWNYADDNGFGWCFIRINPDSTFNYESGGCTGTCYSSGKWTMKEGLLVLNSHENYFPKEYTVAIDSVGKALERITMTIDPNTISSSLIPCGTMLDSATTYFRNMCFWIKGDTMYQVPEGGGPQLGSKFYAAYK